MASRQQARAAKIVAINQRILDYLLMNRDANTSQEPYKSDFFKIFKCAYKQGLCSRKLIVSADRRSCRIEDEPIIDSHSIRTFVKTNGLSANRGAGRNLSGGWACRVG